MFIREGAPVEPDDTWDERIPLVGGAGPMRGTWRRRAEILLVIGALGIAYAVVPSLGGTSGSGREPVEPVTQARAADLGSGFVATPAAPEPTSGALLPTRLVRAWNWVEGMATGLILPTDVSRRLADQDPSLARLVWALWRDAGTAVNR
jgi:hypothetical protein